MRYTKAVIGIAVLFALALSAVGATSASAADRAYTCEPSSPPSTQFKDAHCRTAAKPEESGFKHTLITATSTSKTHIWATNEKTASETTAASVQILKAHIAGVETAIQCTGVTGTGKLWNNATAAFASGKLLYTGCTVTLPAGKGCKVVGGSIETNELTGTTEGTTGTRVKISPTTGGVFATIPIEGCEKERPPKGSYTVEGSLEAPTSGATIVANHNELTTEGKLLFGGTAAGLEGALTLTMKNEVSEVLENAITLTP